MRAAPIQLPRLSPALPPAMDSPSLDTGYSSEEDSLRTPLTDDDQPSPLWRDSPRTLSHFQQQQLEAAASKHLFASRPDQYHAFYQLSPSQHALDLTSAPFNPPSFVPSHPIAIPSLALSLEDEDMPESPDVTMSCPPSPIPLLAQVYSARFPEDHELNPYFIHTYELEDELGAGGYGFVMTARNRLDGQEAAVKFIIKAKVPEHAWVEDESFGRIPSEVMLVSLLDHDNIVRCVDIFEDALYFYLVQELHGTPWVSKKKAKRAEQLAVPSMTPPSLTPSSSCSTLDSMPMTPHPTDTASWEEQLRQFASEQQKRPETLDAPPRPVCGRRPSHDLFECIEQSKHKRLSESQARYIFAQVVEAVHYLELQGITHRDIKDENLVIDSEMKVKLIDFGSAVVSDPDKPRPFYQLFYGTTAYAASEILQRKPYQAPQAEIWTLGILLSYLLTGASPFPSEQEAIAGRISIRESIAARLSPECIALMRRCLEADPARRADIYEVRAHPWLQRALDGQ